jgi:hypothetical protein
VLLPPLAGESRDGGEELRSSPPPAPSPIEGEGRCLRAIGMKYLSLSAIKGEGSGSQVTCMQYPPLSALRMGEGGREGMCSQLYGQPPRKNSLNEKRRPKLASACSRTACITSGVIRVIPWAAA